MTPEWALAMPGAQVQGDSLGLRRGKAGMYAVNVRHSKREKKRKLSDIVCLTDDGGEYETAENGSFDPL